MNARPGPSSGNPSPPSSITRSSDGGAGAAAAAQQASASNEDHLAGHFVALRRFLAPSLHDDRQNPRSNRAKDKLLRLSPVQFHELSTDVYDELLRRQSASGARRSGPGGYVAEGAPPFLLPEDNFHPRRNQARQKLSTLPSPRFRDLATDVFYELERRFPRFAASDMDRVNSAASSVRLGHHHRKPSLVGLGRVGPSPSVTTNPAGDRTRHPSDSDPFGRVDRPNGLDSTDGPDYGRPLPKTFQSNTIVPNKSTLVEDDDDDPVAPHEETDVHDPYGLNKRRSRRLFQKSMDPSDVRPSAHALSSLFFPRFLGTTV